MGLSIGVGLKKEQESETKKVQKKKVSEDKRKFSCNFVFSCLHINFGNREKIYYCMGQQRVLFIPFL